MAPANAPVAALPITGLPITGLRVTGLRVTDLRVTDLLITSPLTAGRRIIGAMDDVHPHGWAHGWVKSLAAARCVAGGCVVRP